MNTDLTNEQQQALVEIGDKFREAFPVESINIQVGENGTDFRDMLFSIHIVIKVRRQ